jgi:hypothetical protein
MSFSVGLSVFPGADGPRNLAKAVLSGLNAFRFELCRNYHGVQMVEHSGYGIVEHLKVLSQIRIQFRKFP